MPLTPALNAKLNEQITNEFVASQTYLAMACQFEAQGLKVLAKYFRKQTEEEREHALKILDYIPSVEGEVTLGAIAAPQLQYPSVLAAIEAALAHERKVTQQINDLMGLAVQDRDYATQSFLKWYVDEQVEEVDSMIHLVQIAKMAGPNLLLLESYVARMMNS